MIGPGPTEAAPIIHGILSNAQLKGEALFALLPFVNKISRCIYGKASTLKKNLKLPVC
jgi:hypothetical protein